MRKKINISDKTLDYINQQRIKPIPRWEFVVKKYSIAIAFFVCIISLILGVAVSLLGILDQSIIPNLWIIIVFLFLFLSYFLFEKTKKSYRFQKIHVVLSLIIIGFFTGTILYKVGIATKVDKDLEARISYYRQVVPLKMETWNDPESGLLSGVIIKIIDQNSFEIKDFKGNTWSINSQNALIRNRVKIISGEEVKIIGEKIDNNYFSAKEIRPWQGTGRMTNSKN